MTGIPNYRNRRAVVFGGRLFAVQYTSDNHEREFWREELDLLNKTLDELTPIELAQGGARGADTRALEWAVSHSVPCSTFRAEWTRFGLSAGVLRNQRMIDEWRPELGIRFPGGKGTADMARRLKKADIDVVTAVLEVEAGARPSIFEGTDE